MQETIAVIDNLVAAFRRGENPQGYIVTLNPEGIWLAKHDPSFRQIIEEATIVTPDGNGILWAAKQQGEILPERVTGIDLIYQLCSQAVDQGWRIYLLGAKDQVVSKAAQNLKEYFPGINIVGVDNGYFEEKEEQLIKKIAKANADIVFAALGMPFQEKWLAENGKKLACGVSIGVGGSFDVIAGEIKRAPKWIQCMSLEWLWRLIKDPKRWRRASIIPKYMIAVKKNIKNSG